MVKVGSLKSSVLTLALVHGHIDAQTAVDTARVEEEFQIAEHGFVEEGYASHRGIS
jgi:chaperone required for assembly of F1-ATPase